MVNEINEIEDDRQKHINNVVDDFERAYETDDRKVREELIKDKDNFEFYKHFMEDWKREIDNQNQFKERLKFRKEEVSEEEKRYLRDINLIDDAYFSDNSYKVLSKEAQEYVSQEKEKLDKDDAEFEKIWLKYKTEAIKRQGENNTDNNFTEKMKIVQEVYQNARDSYDFERNKKVEKINEKIKLINEGCIKAENKKDSIDIEQGNNNVDISDRQDDSQSKNKKIEDYLESLENGKELIETLEKNKDCTTEIYSLGKDICLDCGLKTFTDHTQNHAEDVAYKSFECKNDFDKYVSENPESKKYIGEVNDKRLMAACVWHDTGMNGGFKDFNEYKEWYKEQKDIYDEVCRLSECGKYNDKTEDKSPEEIIRKKHALNSAIHVLENREKLEEQDINADAVALECFLHSKSASEVNDLSNRNQMAKAIEILKQESTNRGVEFNYSWLVKGTNDKGEYEFNEDELKAIMTEASILRMGDANREVGSKLQDMNQRDIEISIDKDKCNKAKDIKGEMKSITEVKYGDENINFKSNAKSRAILLGEKNIESIDTNYNEEDGRLQYRFIINDADFAPYCTIEQINERIKEIDSTIYAKGNKKIDICIRCNSGDVYKFTDKLNEETGPLSKKELENKRKYINEINVK